MSLSAQPFACLWFEDRCEDAVNHYVEVFPNSKINTIVRYPSDYQVGPDANMAGKVLTAVFELNGVRFQALDGGPHFKLSPAVSFVIECEDQNEIDRYWEALSVVPEAEQCGWCQDEFGVSWQIVPKILGQYMTDSDPAKVQRVTEAFMVMKKMDIAALTVAFEGGE